jgi:hypothetical protein
MSIRCILSLSLLAVLRSSEAAAAAAAEPIAIVYSLAGEAAKILPAAGLQPLRLFDRIPAGTVLEVGPGSRLSLAFVSGLRFELGERSRVTLRRKGLVSRTGPVRSLPSVPPLPRLALIAEDDRPGARAGAVRIRSETISGLSPDRGEASLAAATRLRFDPVSAAPLYRVEIFDQRGNVLFRIDTPATEVLVPPKILASGRIYHWTVETHDRPGAVARGEAALVTLDAGQERAREKLRRCAQSSGAADDLRLLAGVDRALGLREAVQKERCQLSVPGVVERRSPAGRAARSDPLRERRAVPPLPLGGIRALRGLEVDLRYRGVLRGAVIETRSVPVAVPSLTWSWKT